MKHFLQKTHLATGLAVASLGLAISIGANTLNAFATESGSVAEMTDENRYQLKRDGDDFVRMDRQTGTMSLCRIRGNNLVCQMAADDREALEEELVTMQERLARIEDRVKRSDRSRNDDWMHDDDFPLEEEIEDAMRYSSKVIRRFFDVMKDIRKDLEY